jgi:hypothetical protein
MVGNLEHSEQQVHAVDLYHSELGDLGKGTLYFDSNNWAHVVPELNSLSKKIVDSQTFHVVKARASSGRVFSLFECKVSGFTLYADYVIVGDIDAARFKRMDIRYSEISEWFLRWQRIQGMVGEKLTWANSLKQFSVNISSGQERFTISSEYVGDLSRQGEDHVLHEHIEFIFEKSNGNFGLKDIQSKALELSCLLSILIAYPISIISVHVLADNGLRCPVYFPTFKKMDRNFFDSSFAIKCFMQSDAIGERWQKIFENYYKSLYRKVSWVRLAGMQRYEGFREYKALGYVSLLDRYVTDRLNGTKNPQITNPSSKKLSKLKAALADLSPPIVGGQLDEVINAVSRTFSDQRELTFAQKYKLALADTDDDVKRIVNFSDKDFKLIKRIRDKIAHGDDPGLQDSDFSSISVIVSRIALLLTYWAFLDFSLTKSDFLHCLTTTHSRLRFDAQLDDMHLARVTNTAEFFKVSQTTFQTISTQRKLKVFACFVQDVEGDIEFSESYTKTYRDWQMKATNGRTHSFEEIFGVAKDVVRVVGRAYIESGTNQLELHSFFVFDGSRMPF